MRILNQTTENTPIDTIRPHPKNPRQGNTQAIHDSIQNNGFYGHIIAQKTTGHIITGNHRWQAAKQAGATQIPVTWIDVDNEHALRILLADNHTNDLATYDHHALADLLADLPDLTGTTYTTNDLDDLLRELNPPTPPEPPPPNNTAQELQKKWDTHTGQLWQIGPHRILCGDSTNPEDFAQLMQNELAEMIWTDPPYGVAIGEKNKHLNTIGPSNRVEHNLENDTLNEHELTALIEAVFNNTLNHCQPGGAWYVAAPAGPLHVIFGLALKQRNIWRQTIQWVKNNSTFSPMGVDYHWQAEPIFYGWKPGAAHRYHGGRTQTTVWNIDQPQKNPEHPTMKPVELVQRAIENSSRRHDIILDPFSGSGTTLIASHNTERHGRAIEIDPAYVAVTLQRLNDLGLTPELQPHPVTAYGSGPPVHLTS